MFVDFFLRGFCESDREGETDDCRRIRKVFFPGPSTTRRFSLSACRGRWEPWEGAWCAGAVRLVVGCPGCWCRDVVLVEVLGLAPGRLIERRGGDVDAGDPADGADSYRCPAGQCPGRGGALLASLAGAPAVDGGEGLGGGHGQGWSARARIAVTPVVTGTTRKTLPSDRVVRWGKPSPGSAVVRLCDPRLYGFMLSV